ncbi:hypothetical protein LSG31_20875 [Fodinisporobacter ferrooxydans]|uniref:KOW domain-containing protein n=1 Tax=Fodinisporobacter ferrooxydans TaxID=2901836 RepID=A0ABY4CIF0_9BACL|nr:hypothetical protein LSG31_20875 [Alicyclobacillaceae bacterium MYW30-H2]
MKLNFKNIPPSIHLGDTITVYTTGYGPGGQGITGIVLGYDEHNLFIGVRISQQTFNRERPVDGIATIPFRHITTIIQKIK